MAHRRRTKHEHQDLLLAEYERRLPKFQAMQRDFRTCALPIAGKDFRFPAYTRLPPRRLRAQVLADWISAQPVTPKWIQRLGHYRFACWILAGRPTMLTRAVLALQFRLSPPTVEKYLKAARARRRAATRPHPTGRILPS